MLDISDFDGGDELRGAIEASDAARRRELRDREGTLVARIEGMEEVALSDDAWIEEAKGEAGPDPEPEEERPYPLIPNLANPAGLGYCVSPHKEAVDGIQLPCLEPRRLLTRKTSSRISPHKTSARFNPPPASLRTPPVGTRVPDLQGLALGFSRGGGGENAALAAFDPDDPDDKASIEAIEAMEIPVMQEPWYRAAHPDVQVTAIKGDEEVFLDNFSPAGPIFFRLPGVHPKASVDLGSGAQSVLMTIDTLMIDVGGAPLVTLLWRGWHPLSGQEVFGYRLSRFAWEPWTKRAGLTNPHSRCGYGAQGRRRGTGRWALRRGRRRSLS